jgi:hypothetical protein
MTKRGILLAALAIVGLAGIGQDGSAYAAELPLTPGWDVCEKGGGRVHYNVSPGKLHVTFHLQGARPKTTYRFGIGVFKPQVSAFGELPKYGGWQEFTRTDCGPKQITKKGTHQTFIFGTVETNSAGNAFLGKQLRVGKGTYTLQFAVSGHNDDRAFFKSGNSYADTVTVTIP